METVLTHVQLTTLLLLTMNAVSAIHSLVLSFMILLFLILQISQSLRQSLRHVKVCVGVVIEHYHVHHLFCIGGISVILFAIILVILSLLLIVLIVIIIVFPGKMGALRKRSKCVIIR